MYIIIEVTGGRICGVLILQSPMLLQFIVNQKLLSMYNFIAPQSQHWNEVLTQKQKQNKNLPKKMTL